MGHQKVGLGEGFDAARMGAQADRTGTPRPKGGQLLSVRAWPRHFQNDERSAKGLSPWVRVVSKSPQPVMFVAWGNLETFQEVGFPLEEHVGDHGRKAWCLDPAKTQPGLGFAFDEAVALCLGRRFLDPLAGTVFWDAAHRAFRKVRAMLSPAALKYLDKFAAVFHRTLVGASDYSTKGELIDRLVMTMEDRRITHITYRSLQATEPTTYDIYPSGMIHHRGSLYLVGWAPRRERVQHWKIDRIEEVEVTQLQFHQPARRSITGIMAAKTTDSEA